MFDVSDVDAAIEREARACAQARRATTLRARAYEQGYIGASEASEDERASVVLILARRARTTTKRGP